MQSLLRKFEALKINFKSDWKLAKLQKILKVKMISP